MRKVVILGLAVMMILWLGHTIQAKDWEENFEKALVEAKSSGRYLLLDFSGSDWCGWCIKLEKEVFSQQEFKDFADKNLVCLLVDFPRNKKQSDDIKKQNHMLADKYEIQGYPTIILLSPDGKLVGKTGYKPGGAVAYVDHLKKIIDGYKAK